MINITIEAANGADARQQMLDLLGVNTGIVVGNGKNSFSELPQVKDEGLELSEGYKALHNITDVQEEPLAEQPKPEQNSRKRRTKAEIEAEKAALDANTGSEEPPASTENTAAPEKETVIVEETVTETSDNDFENFLKANPGEIEKQVEKFFSEPVEFKSVVSRDFMRGAAIVLGRKGKRDAVKEVMGNSSFSAQPGKEQVTDEQLNDILAKFVKIYQSI